MDIYIFSIAELDITQAKTMAKILKKTALSAFLQELIRLNNN